MQIMDEIFTDSIPACSKIFKNNYYRAFKIFFGCCYLPIGAHESHHIEVGGSIQAHSKSFFKLARGSVL